MASIKCTSEIAPLKRVIIHRPDQGIDRVTPKRLHELLFDDIVYLEQMQAEHDIFSSILRAFLGTDNVIETRDLLVQAIEHNTQTTTRMIEEIVDYEELPARFQKILGNLNSGDLADTLITGYLKSEDYILFDPIPNFIFTRDIAVTVNDHVIITKANKLARFRENFLTRFIFTAHPLFEVLEAEGRIIDMNNVDQFPPSKKGESISIEGGDVMIFNKDYLLIGLSERTNEHSIKALTKVLLEKGVVNNVVSVSIPADRSYMHLDTIFTRISEAHCVAFKPIVVEGLSSYVEVFRKDGGYEYYYSIKDFILAEINPNMQFILSGNGESPYQEREQWTDGCNLVALRDGVGITYDRNIVTAIAFKEAGFDIMTAADFLAKVEAGQIDPSQLSQTIISIPSNELSRARGGSHCMTCPIERL